MRAHPLLFAFSTGISDHDNANWNTEVGGPALLNELDSHDCLHCVYSIVGGILCVVQNLLTDRFTPFFKKMHKSALMFLGNELKEEDSKTYHTSLAS